MIKNLFIRRVVQTVDAVRHEEENARLTESAPLLIMHASLIGLFFVGFSWVALAVCLFLYGVRVFALTGGYHRYFSHNSYKTSRVFQFVLAWVGASSAQLGPLWWASHHRRHHQYSDTKEDIHSPRQRGFLWSHIGWLFCRKYARSELDRVRDFAKFPEIRFVDRWHVLPVLCLVALIFSLGWVLEVYAPQLGTTKWQMLMYGFFLSTVMVYHVTFAVNSVTHIVGNQRYPTNDDSRNHLVVALLTFGEGWHNNHHRYPVCTRQGFFWWEIDATYYILWALSKLRIVWDLRPPAPAVYTEAAALAAR